jgi:hypothetical protein
MTAAAVALMTAVTPPDCAYSSLPWLIPAPFLHVPARPAWFDTIQASR